MNNVKLTVKERLIRIETMLSNHLKHHEKQAKWGLRLIDVIMGIGILIIAIIGVI